LLLLAFQPVGLFASAPANLFAQAAEVAGAVPGLTQGEALQNPSTVSGDITLLLTSVLAPLVTQHPWVATLFLVIGLLRTVFKPLVTFLEQRAASTADPADDARLQAAEASWWFRTLAWALDFGASIKVGPQKR